MGTPVTERMKAYRQRMSEAGYRRVCFNATPETAERLDAVRGQERTIDSVINAALASFQGEGGEGVAALVGPSEVTALHAEITRLQDQLTAASEREAALVGPSEVTALHDEITRLQDQLTAASEREAGLVGPSEVTALHDEITRLQDQLTAASEREAGLVDQAETMRGWFGEMTGYPKSIQREAAGMLASGANHEAVLTWLEATIGKAPRSNASKVFAEWRKGAGQS